jgi:pyruvate formate lyase activating enzyme
VIKKFGKMMTIDELTKELCKDEIFYFHSDGGVTLSGGEPFSQSEYASKLLSVLKSRGINTAIETSLFAPWEDVSALLPYLDHVFVDIKHMSPKEHQRLTCVDNFLIFENLRKIDQTEYPVSITIRVPLIPGLNDSDGNLDSLAEFTRELTNKLQNIELLPYHRLGLTTYGLLNVPYTLESIKPPTPETLSERASYLAAKKPGVPILAGGRCF